MIERDGIAVRGQCADDDAFWHLRAPRIVRRRGRATSDDRHKADRQPIREPNGCCRSLSHLATL
jgi:hypothetical protein